MSAVNIPSIGSPLAAKVYGAAVFAAVQNKPGFMNLLSESAPQLGDAAKKMKGQSDAGSPIVKVTDLSKSAGDKVSVDLFNIFTGKPVMGDKRIEGRGMNTSTSSQDVVINRSRGMSDTGGKMTQKRTKHNLRTVIMAGLTNWAQRLEDQRCLVHLAGARGSQLTTDWVIPSADDAEFSEIMVNDVKAPSKNRRFIAGMSAGSAATTASSMGTSDILTLSEIDVISGLLKESNVPLQPIVMKEDPYSWDMPLYVMFVTERQWALMKAISGSKWLNAVTNAVKRFEAGKRHPLFMGDSIMWNGILVKPMNRYAIRFAAGETIQECQTDTSATETGVAAAVATDRAIIVGAQALIKAYGNEATSDYYYSWNEELVDHKSAVEVSLSMMEGTAKTRFTINGSVTDHGVAVVDSYAPALGTSAFNTALTVSGKY